MFCSKCGKELGENEKFCPECGIPAGTVPFQNGEDAAYAESKVHYNKTGGGVPIHNYDPRFDYNCQYVFQTVLQMVLIRVLVHPAHKLERTAARK